MEGDAAQVVKILGFKMASYEEFVKALSNNELKQFAQHVMKQNNMDCNMDYVKNHFKIRQEFEDWVGGRGICFPNLFCKLFPK